MKIDFSSVAATDNMRPGPGKSGSLFHCGFLADKSSEKKLDEACVDVGDSVPPMM
jgi:hypothetical protein